MADQDSGCPHCIPRARVQAAIDEWASVNDDADEDGGQYHLGAGHALKALLEEEMPAGLAALRAELADSRTAAGDLATALQRAERELFELKRKHCVTI